MRRERDKSIEACRALVELYERMEEGTVQDWSDVDYVYDLAFEAINDHDIKGDGDA